MSAAVLEQQVDVRHLDTILDFAEEAFDKADDGDLAAASRIAARRAVISNLVSGPLWDEVGDQIVAHFVRTKRFHVLRRWSGGQLSGDTHTPAAADPDAHDPLDTRYSVNGAWLRLGDLGRIALRALADDRLKRATTMTTDARIFERLAKGLKADQKVADKYSSADLLRIRQEVEREEG